jgi:hypothetical protein
MSRGIIRLVAVVVSMGGAMSAAPSAQRPPKGGPVDSGPGSIAAARKYLEGRWSLRSFDVFPPGGAPLRLGGAGTLVYDAFGNLDIEIRVDESTATQLEAAGIPSNKGLVSMRGRTAVDMQARTLTYILRGQPPLGAPSGPLALNRSRHWEVEGTLLTLTTRTADGQLLSKGVWEKLP